MQWYVMRSKPNKEEFLFGQLRIRQIDTYYPCIEFQPTNPRARKRRPYFPGYLFISTDINLIAASTLNWIPGSLGLVDFDGQIASVPEHLINGIRSQVDRINKDGLEKTSNFKTGDLVTVQSGPFSGYQAIFAKHLSGTERVSVLLNMLWNRQVSLELSNAQLIKN